MHHLNFHQDRALPLLASVGPSWSRGPAATGASTYDMTEYDQRMAAYTFTAGGLFGNATYKSIPNSGPITSPISNLAVTVGFTIDKARRNYYDVFPEELLFSVNNNLSYQGVKMPMHLIGLHQLNRWLADENEDEAIDFGYHKTAYKLTAKFRWLAFGLTNPWPTDGNGHPRQVAQETHIMQGRARTQDIWSSSEQREPNRGLNNLDRLWLLWKRRNRKTPEIFSNPRFTKHLIDQKYVWSVEPVSTHEYEPEWSLYNNWECSGEGGEYYGTKIDIGVFSRDLTMQNGGQKNFRELANTYLHGRDSSKQYEAWKQMKSIEVFARQM